MQQSCRLEVQDGRAAPTSLNVQDARMKAFVAKLFAFLSFHPCRVYNFFAFFFSNHHDMSLKRPKQKCLVSFQATGQCVAETMREDD